MLTAPVVSEKAKNILESAFKNELQFLPFHSIKGKLSFAMNVTCLVKDLLNMTKSDIHYGDDGKRIISIDRAVFKKPLPESLPPIFKLSINPSDIFVTQPFVDLVIEQKLTGLSLGKR